MHMWFATMPVSPAAVASTTLHSTIGEWMLDVNLMGVLYGIRTLLPHIRAYREGGHIFSAAMQHTAPIAAISPMSIVDPGVIFAQRPRKGL